MNNRKELINAIATGDVKRLKRLRKNNLPILIRAPRTGKYYNYPENKEISHSEIEELKKDHTVIQLTQAEGCTFGKISNSEDEVTE